MLTQSLLGLSVISTASAFPGFRRQARQAAPFDLADCPPASTVTAYVPIITEIPFCTGNVCPTNTIISQGQPVTTSTLLSVPATGSIGQVFGGTVAINNGAAATNLVFPSFTICESSCTVGGNAYGSGTVFFATSTPILPSQTLTFGGQTLTDSSGLITAAAPIIT